MHMDTSPTKRKTGTVLARLTSYNGRMKWTNSKPDHRHQHQSNGKEKRNWMNNRNRNFTDVEEQSQSTQRRGMVPTTQGLTRGAPTTAKIPAGAFMDHEDRRRKPTTTAERAQRWKSERGEARDKSHTKRREKQSLLEKIAGPLMPPPLRSRRSSLEGGKQTGEENFKLQILQEIETKTKATRGTRTQSQSRIRLQHNKKQQVRRKIKQFRRFERKSPAQQTL